MTTSFRGIKLWDCSSCWWLSSIKPLTKRLKSITVAAYVKTNNTLFSWYILFIIIFQLIAVLHQYHHFPVAYQSPNITNSRYIRILNEAITEHLHDRKPKIHQCSSLQCERRFIQGKLHRARNDGSECFAQEEIESTYVYWTRNLISYLTVFLKPWHLFMCACHMHILCFCFPPHALHIFTKWLHTASIMFQCSSHLASSPRRSSHAFTSIVSTRNHAAVSRSQPGQLCGIFFQILYQKRWRGGFASSPGSPNPDWISGKTELRGWRMDDGCDGTIRLVSVMNLFYLSCRTEPSGRAKLNPSCAMANEAWELIRVKATSQ